MVVIVIQGNWFLRTSQGQFPKTPQVGREDSVTLTGVLGASGPHIPQPCLVHDAATLGTDRGCPTVPCRQPSAFCPT